MWNNISNFIPPVRWVLALLLLTLIFAVARTPATWAAHFMTQGNTLGLSGVRGTVWEGQARMASVEVDNQHYSLGALRWDLSPLSLLTLTPCADVNASLETQSIDGRVCAGLGGKVRMSDTSIDAPANLVQAGLPFPVQGQLSANIQALAMDDGQMQNLEGSLSWTGARVQAEGTWVTLGSYAAEAHFDPEQNAIVADVFDLDGPIDIEAQARLPLAGGIFVKGQMEMTDDFSDQIQAREWMPMVLDHQQGNRYNIDLQF